jgi:hypothetical protein
MLINVEVYWSLFDNSMPTVQLYNWKSLKCEKIKIRHVKVYEKEYKIKLFQKCLSHTRRDQYWSQDFKLCSLTVLKKRKKERKQCLATGTRLCLSVLHSTHDHCELKWLAQQGTIRHLFVLWYVINRTNRASNQMHIVTTGHLQQ